MRTPPLAVKRIQISILVAAARDDHGLPEALRGPLAGIGEVMSQVASFPHGFHVCEVDIDPETGCVEIARYTAVDDVGRAVNPLILHGQTHGGIAQGAGQALLERCVYDPAAGQLLTGSFNGLRDAAGARHAVLRHRAERGAVDQPRIHWVFAAAAKAGSRPHWVSSSMRSPISASPISKCRLPPSASGEPSDRR
jgi:hypothetical protein